MDEVSGASVPGGAAAPPIQWAEGSTDQAERRRTGSWISTGWPDGTYRPVTPVARDAMAAFIYRMKN